MEKYFKAKDILKLKTKALKLLNEGDREKSLPLYRISRLMKIYNG